VHVAQPLVLVHLVALRLVAEEHHGAGARARGRFADLGGEADALRGGGAAVGGGMTDRLEEVREEGSLGTNSRINALPQGLSVRQAMRQASHGFIHCDARLLSQHRLVEKAGHVFLPMAGRPGCATS
jgi:hypothetical protein